MLDKEEVPLNAEENSSGQFGSLESPGGNLRGSQKGAPSEKKPGDVPISTVIIIGAILMIASFGAVFLVLSSGRAGTGPLPDSLRREEWEYWGDKFHLKIEYNTSEPVIAGKNFVQVGRGCTLQINATSGISEKQFPSRIRTIVAKSGDPISENQTKIGNLSAEIITALYKTNSYYCANRAFTAVSGKYCKFEVIFAECDGKRLS